MPVIFVAHGAPTLAIDDVRGAELARWASAMPRPTAILCISAHWERTPPTLGALDHSRLIYDFGGFPDALYRIQYPAPGAPELAEQVRVLLAPRYGTIEHASTRHLDHGAWVPLYRMFPAADIPVLQLSLPKRGGAAAALELGVHLAPLRQSGVLIVASGVLVHNLSRLSPDGTLPPSWAIEFDDWCARALTAWNVEDLVEYRTRAPQPVLAHPTEEHFTPLLVALGAASVDAPAVTFPISGFEYGTVSRRCVQFG